VEIRAAGPADASDVADLLAQLGYPATPEQVIARLARMSEEPGQHALVADVDRRVVGLATVIVRHVINADAPFARVASIVVDERYRSRGIGHSLIEAAEAIARDAGCNMIEVTSGEHRTRAHEFYRRLGFEERPRRFIKRLDRPSV
jgi:GNAT superfamily N-acetyltransferase